MTPRARRLLAWSFAPALVLVFVGGVYLLHRPVFGKCAAESLCFADWTGFAAACGTDSQPAGLLGWCGAFLAAAATTPVGAACAWFLLPVVLVLALLWAFPVLRRPGLDLLPAVPALVPAVRFATIGAQIWSGSDFAFATRYHLGLLFAVAVGGLFLRAARRCRTAVLLAFVPALALAFVPFGVFAVLAAALAAAVALGLPGVRASRVRVLLPVLGFALVAAAPLALAGPWFHDLACSALYVPEPVFFVGPGTLAPNLAAALALAVLVAAALYQAHEGTGTTGRAVAVPVSCLFLIPYSLLLLLASLPAFAAVDVCAALACERHLDAFDYRGVLAVDRANPVPQRMVVADRICAMFARGTISEDLFVFPLLTFHETNAAEEMRMDGYRLLFHYGLVYPARRCLFEQVQATGWTPPRLRTAAECALVAGELPLALRGATELRRCAFHAAEADRLFAFLRAPSVLTFPAELRRVATLAEETRTCSEGSAFFASGDASLETLIYNAYSVRKRLSPETFPMYVASMLLRKDLTLFDNDLRALAAQCPAGRPMPRAWQEAYMTWLAKTPRDRRPAPIPGSLDPRAVDRFNAFQTFCDAHSLNGDYSATAAEQDSLRRSYADSFYFYNTFIR